MAERTWDLSLGERAYTVKLEHGFWSGKRKIFVNGELVYEGQKLMDAGSNIPIEIAGHPVVVRIIHTITGRFEYDLVVQGQSVASGEAVPDNAPTWSLGDSPDPSITREKMEKELRTNGYILLAVGLLNFAGPDLLDKGLGVLLMAVGIGSLVYQRRVMLIFLGVALVAIGAVNLLTTELGYWWLIGLVQIGLGLASAVSYRKYPAL